MFKVEIQTFGVTDPVETSLCDALITLRIQLSKRFPQTILACAPGLEVLDLFLCGADRSRTDDIQLAKLALYQLSYSPTNPVVGTGGPRWI